MNLTDSVVRPVVAVILAAVVANCNEGCGPYISPADAYAMEMSGCVAKRNTVVRECVEKAKTLQESRDCREEAEEAYRICTGQVERKYFNYNSNGSYPSSN
jgi:hypothetical protein